MHTAVVRTLSRLRMILASLPIVVSLVVIGGVLRPRRPEPPVRTPANIVVQWQEVAHEANLSDSVTDRISGLLCEGFGVKTSASELEPHPDMRDSLARFVAEFHWAFGDSEEGVEFSYYVAWLLLEVVNREIPSSAALMQARHDYRQCLDTLEARLRSGLCECFGSDHHKHEKAIETGIQWTRKTLMERFDMLQADPLFSSFKGPLGAEAIRSALHHAMNAANFNVVFLGRAPRKAQERKVYARRLRGVFESIPELFLFGLIAGDIRGQLHLNPYWGPAGYTMQHRSGDCHWPVHVRLHVPRNTEI